MITTRKIKVAQELIAAAKKAKKTIAFIPTMGGLHRGHLKLIQKAKAENNYTVTSIFLNPLQFNSEADFENYPHNLKLDKTKLETEGVDLLFCPDKQEIYPKGFSTYAYESELSSYLCGKYRPGHFRGVCTVIIKLLNIILPDCLYLGQKDYQQALILRKIIKDLAFKLRIRIISTVREKDGLALSSRNQRLNPKQRQASCLIYQSLLKAKRQIESGEKNPKKIVNLIKNGLKNPEFNKIEYIAVSDPKSLKPLKKIKDSALVSLAVFAGKTRLIDNIIAKIKK